MLQENTEKYDFHRTGAAAEYSVFITEKIF